MGIEIPDYLKGIVDQSSLSMISKNSSAPRISIRGRQFRFITGGEETFKTTDPIYVVVLGVVPGDPRRMCKTFYKDAYTPGSSDPPDCSSINGIGPDEWVDSPQCADCSSCEHNKWGSAKSMTGKKAKACKDSKRLMIIRADDLTKCDDHKDLTIYVFTVTISSLESLTEYGKFLITNGNIPTPAVITKVEFVDSEFPQVAFSFVSFLDAKHGEPLLIRANAREWDDNIKAIGMAGDHVETRQIAGPASTPSVPDVSKQPASTSPEDPLTVVDDVIKNW